MDYSHIVERFNATNNAELELRFSVDKILFKTILDKCKGEMSLEQSVNFIYNNKIRQLLFIDGKKKHTSFVEKKQLINKKSPLYKLVLSTENKISEFNADLTTLVRIKLRLSIFPSELEGWRVDFTMTKNLTDMKKVKPAKESMLYKLDINDFNTDKAPWEHADSFELEVECIDKEIYSPIEDVIDYIHSLAGHIRSSEYNTLVNFISELVHGKKSTNARKIYNKVIELNSDSYSKVYENRTDYYLLDKADGIRFFVILHNKTLTALSDGIDTTPLNTNHRKRTIVDTERVVDEETKQVFYYVFDVLMFEGKSVTGLPTSERISYIPRVVEMSEQHIRPKPIIPITSNFESELNAINDSHKNYESDGIIFTPKDTTYRNTKSWKWKPLTHMSIDFLVKKAGRPREYILFSGISQYNYDKLKLTMLPGFEIYGKYFPIQFSPSSDPFAYKYTHPEDSKFIDIADNVCEFKRVDDSWVLMRIRTDRDAETKAGTYFGNDFYVAEYTWQNYKSPLTFEHLLKPNVKYFQEEKRGLYKQATSFNSFAKSRILTVFKDKEWVIDLAAGKGQDMFRLAGMNVKNAVFLDIDQYALSALVERKHKNKQPLNMNVLIQHTDLTDDYKHTKNNLHRIGVPAVGVDGIMCNFAIHYIIDKLDNLIHLVHSMLKPGGVFVFAAFDGKRIVDLLKNAKEWHVREGDAIKYSIVKKYKSNTLTRTGQQIDVLLPFSMGKYYTEYLVNFDHVLSEFKNRKFIIEKRGNFSEFLNQKPLGDSDTQFVSLYSYAVVRKPDTKNDIISSLSGSYDIDEFKTAFITPQPLRPVVTLDDIKTILPYAFNSGIVKMGHHIGQRKLLLSEIQFLSKTKSKYCIYAGSSPGNKNMYLSEIFPHIKFIDVDPNKFDIVVGDKSHRAVKHDDIVHLYYHYPTKSNTYKNNTSFADMTAMDKKNMLDFVIQSNAKIFIIEDYMTIDIAQWCVGLGDVSFISDIRSNVSGSEYPQDYDIYWNMAMMYNWITIMRPEYTMLKHRDSYGTDVDKTIRHPDDFKLALSNGIDFASDYKDNVFRMSKGTLYIQAWAGRSSSELRLHIKRNDITNTITYDKCEDKMFYFNSIGRSWVWRTNKNANKSLGFCHCNDCALENIILTGAGLDVHKAVNNINRITNRPLLSHHRFTLWVKNVATKSDVFTEMVRHALDLFKKTPNRYKNDGARGNTGETPTGEGLVVPTGEGLVVPTGEGLVVPTGEGLVVPTNETPTDGLMVLPDTLKWMFPETDKPLYIVDASRYSVSSPRMSIQISEQIKHLVQIPDIHITDATAHVGGNTIGFATAFPHVNAVEISKTTYTALTHNIKAFDIENVKTYNESYLDIQNDLKQDIVFFDPPWGGPEYKLNKVMMLYLDDIPIYEVVCRFEVFPVLVILKCPYNLDFALYKRSIPYSNHITKKHGNARIIYSY